MRNDPIPLRASLFERLRRDPDVLTLIEKADDVLGSLGYTDHGRRHVTLVAVTAMRVLSSLRFDRHTADLAGVAALLHDIGNCAGRENHAAVGATMAYQLLTQRGAAAADVADIMAAIGNHDETEGGAPVNAVSAALILADKADVHRSRVRTRDPALFDVHDRVNYAVRKASLDVSAEAMHISLALEADAGVATRAEILELFALRFRMSDAAARFLGCTYACDVRENPID